MRTALLATTISFMPSRASGRVHWSVSFAGEPARRITWPESIIRSSTVARPSSASSTADRRPSGGASVIKPKCPRWIPSSGVPCGATRRAAASRVPSPPKTTTKSLSAISSSGAGAHPGCPIRSATSSRARTETPRSRRVAASRRAASKAAGLVSLIRSPTVGTTLLYSKTAPEKPDSRSGAKLNGYGLANRARLARASASVGFSRSAFL